MTKTKIYFTYESKLGTQLHSSAEAFDFDQAFELAEKFNGWCDENGFIVSQIEMHKCEA